MRLGFAVRVLSRSGMRSHDTRRWQHQPHLSVSLAYLRDILLFLAEQDIHMYRMAANLAPYLTHPDHPEFHQQIATCERELAQVGALARSLGIRLSFHAPAYAVLNASDEGHRARAIQCVTGLAQMLDRMGQPAEGVVVVHVGGHYHRHDAALAALVRTIERLPEHVAGRLVLEHDDRRFDVRDIYWVHQRTGIRLVFDALHHRLYNPARIPMPDALALCLSTWPPQQIPKIHFATPATEMVRDRHQRPHPPRLNRHSHFINPFAFIDFLQALPPTRDFDIMLEAKARDLALLQLRRHLARFAPEWAQRLD